MQSKFYAVQRGRIKGIYRTWAECYEQIKDYPNAKYQSFTNITDAFDYLKWNNAEKLEFTTSGQKKSYTSATLKKQKLEKAIKSIRLYSKKIKKQRLSNHC